MGPNRCTRLECEPGTPRAERWEIARRSAYGIRNKILFEMGFEDYQSYLASPLWHRIRAVVIAAKPTCEACGRPATAVHHGSYTKEVLSGEDLSPLYSVCRKCHERIEFGRGRGCTLKLDPWRATNKLIQMIGRYQKRLKKNEPKKLSKRARRSLVTVPRIVNLSPVLLPAPILKLVVADPSDAIPPIEFTSEASDYCRRC